MQITFNSLALIFGALSFAVSVSATEPITFRPRVWRHYRSDLPLDLNIEIDTASGDVIINRTPSYPGIECYIDNPLAQTPPVGNLFHEDGTDTYQGYLVPLSGVISNPPSSTGTHYQLRFSTTPITGTGVLSTDFTRYGVMCGGNCGGLALEYNSGQNGRWYVIKEDPTTLEWKLRYAIDSASYPALPDGALGGVYVWA